jgi:hypothetical protein
MDAKGTGSPVEESFTVHVTVRFCAYAAVAARTRRPGNINFRNFIYEYLLMISSTLF